MKRNTLSNCTKNACLVQCRLHDVNKLSHITVDFQDFYYLNLNVMLAHNSGLQQARLLHSSPHRKISTSKRCKFSYGCRFISSILLAVSDTVTLSFAGRGSNAYLHCCFCNTLAARLKSRQIFFLI